MKKNMGMLDKVIRVIIAVVIGVLYYMQIITGTLGKALGGASGGYTSGRQEIVDMLRQRSRPYLFSNSVAPMIAASSIAVLDLLERDNSLQQQLH